MKYGLFDEDNESTISEIATMPDRTPDIVSSSFSNRKSMSAEERRLKREKKKQKKQVSTDSKRAAVSRQRQDPDRFQALMKRNEDELLEFVAQVNSVYQDVLKMDAPFMTFVFCGMQSAGKSTIMERFLNAVLNIVQEGTGTRCPLDTTCIHDEKLSDDETCCELKGEELEVGSDGINLTVRQVFERITKHNQKLAEEDRFSTQPLRLIFRSRKVQNMRFVDTPGIISNKSTGKDNREDIKRILQSEMRKPRSKLCVLLDPKEFVTNSIIDFCDDTFGDRDNWIPDTTFLMTKFDMKINDSRTANKANNFFSEYANNSCFPFLVTTPTLEIEKLPPDELFRTRTELLENADSYEKEQFREWLVKHEKYRSDHNDNEILKEEVSSRVGFAKAKATMREVMLQDTLKRLPEVLASLNKDLDDRETEYKKLKQQLEFNDPSNVKNVVHRMVYDVQECIQSYLDGNLEVAMKFPEKLQTLDDEIIEEEDSEWAYKLLNHHSDKEDTWRDTIAEMENYPDYIQSENGFLGGKQYQRAISFFRAVMIESLPDPYELQHLVPTATGFLGGGLQNENWEHAMVKITQACFRDVCHPGINFLIKHIGSIFRRLFEIALDDVREGGHFSSEYQLVPETVDRFLQDCFDSLLWSLLADCANFADMFLEPMYSTVDPTLPTFETSYKTTVPKESRQPFENFVPKESHQPFGHFVPKEDRQPYFEFGHNGQSCSAKDNGEEGASGNGMMSWINSFRKYGNTAKEAKKNLRKDTEQRARRKLSFLPEERESMITEEETEIILNRSFDYMIGLVEFNLILLKFQLNHHLYEKFKKEIRSSLLQKVNDTNWDTLVQKDDSLEARMQAVEKEISALQASLQTVVRMQRKI